MLAMARERIVTAERLDPEEERQNWSLRPTTLDEYIGQPQLVERLRIAIAAARQRGEPLEHILLHGPPGLGKTTLAHVIGREMGGQVHITSGPALTRAGDLVGPLTKLRRGDILFVDEIHRLPAPVEEYIYPAMEDFRIDVSVDSGMHARSITLSIEPFCLIGATTRAGLVSGPLRSRFGMTHHLEFYSDPDLHTIARRSARLLEMQCDSEETLAMPARRSRGTPRIVNRLLRRIRDYAQVHNGGLVTAAIVEEALTLEGIDALGLDPLDRKYLQVLGTTFGGGPAGVEAIAATMSEESDTLEEVVEPYLLQCGYLTRTRRGRQLTPPGAAHVGVPLARPDASLFEASK